MNAPIKLTLQVDGMSCASCVGRVERALQEHDGVLSASVNLATRSAHVSFVPGQTDASAIQDVAGKLGYPARPVQSREDRLAEAKEETRSLAQQTLLAALLTLPVFVLEMGSHLIPAFHGLVHSTIGLQTSWVVQWLLATCVLFGPGRRFFLKGVPALVQWHPDMNSLVALGTGAAWIYSTLATFGGGLLQGAFSAVYFETAAVIVVLILLGRWMEARAKGRTGAAIAALVGLQPKTARVRVGTEVEDVPIDTVRVGQEVIIRPGERLPVDGVVIEGESFIDESMLTGEPMPVAKAAASQVTGGTLNGQGSLVIKTTHVGAATTLAQIIRMVEDAQAAKLPIQGLVDRITLWFVPGVLAIATLTILGWLLLGPEPVLTYALVAGVSVLIIACPCAMGLATPTSIMVGTGRAAELGVLFRKGDALQALSEVEIVAFDKTGTLTQGTPEVIDVRCAEGFDKETLMPLLGAVEARSEHPMAQAITKRAGVTDVEVFDFSVVPGFGVRAKAGGADVLIGSAAWLEQAGVSLQASADEERAAGHSVLYAAVDGKFAAEIVIADPLKEEAQSVIQALKDRGVEVAMISGDRQETAEAVARTAGIQRVIAGVAPDGKVNALKELAQNGQKLAFVGDGINDAPALAHADIGIAIGTGTDVAVEAADVVLMSGALTGVQTAFDVSQKTMRNIRQNLGWAFGYNVALIPVAAGVFYSLFGFMLSPIFAAGAMAMSSVSVLTNALRLRYMRIGKS